MSRISLVLLIFLQPRRIAIRLKRLFRYISRFGGIRGIRTLARVLTGRGPVISVTIPQSRTPLWMRVNSSDVPIFEQIFLWEDYDLPVLIQPRFIIDGGANVGYASVYFANKYPDAQIVAIEPETANFELLKQNTSEYPSVSAIQAAIWNESAGLKIENKKDASWAFRVRQVSTDQSELQALTITDIIQMFNAESVDILKLDIEGAEKEVFSSNVGWLEKVRMVIVELHDQYKPGCSASFYRATEGHGFKKFLRGENVFLFREVA